MMPFALYINGRKKRFASKKEMLSLHDAAVTNQVVRYFCSQVYIALKCKGKVQREPTEEVMYRYKQNTTI